MANPHNRPIQVYAAVAGNLIIAASKLIAAAATGSSAMLSEGIHSLADTGNELLLLVGIRKSEKRPDRKHAFGYGQEIYFWAFVVAMILFSFGGGMSIYEGVRRLHHGEQLSSPKWNYIVLVIAVIAESISFRVAFKKFRASMRPGEHWWRALRRSKDPTVFIVLAEDAAALAGLAVAAVGVFLEQLLQSVVPDAISAMVIGGILGFVAILLARETKALLLGESADPSVLLHIWQIAKNDPDVAAAEPPLTMHLGPSEILVNMVIQFRQGLSGDQIIGAIDRIESLVRQQHPAVRRIFIEAGSLRPNWKEQGERRAG
jgi:cation diffusion facilitator family transporter